MHSPKTEHHPDGAFRVIPLFPELRPYLEEAWEQAEPGAVYCISRWRHAAQKAAAGWANCNLRTQFQKIIRRAGIEPWPKPWQNLRSSRETELAEDFPVHVACVWIGNSKPVALEHYLQVTDDHFQQATQGGTEAAQNAAQYTAELGGEASCKKQEAPAIPEECGGLQPIQGFMWAALDSNQRLLPCETPQSNTPFSQKTLVIQAF